MKLYYAYRWYYVVVILFVAASLIYFLIIDRGYTHYDLLCEKKKQLEHLLETLNEATPKIPAFAHVKLHPGLQDLPGLFTLAFQLNVEIQSLSYHESISLNGNKADTMALVMIGAPASVFNFLSRLFHELPFIVVLDYDFMMQKDASLRTILHIIFFHNHANHQEKSFIQSDVNVAALASLFCTSPTALLSTDSSTLQHIALNQMKLNGVMTDRAHQHDIGLISTPHHISIIVHVGDAIGKQKSIVTSIENGQLKLLLPTQKKTMTYAMDD